MSMRIKRCRICKGRLTKIGSLGNIAISDFTDKPSEGFKCPLELVYCESCTLLQLAHTPPRDKLYKNYWYQSGLNPVIVKDLKEIAKLVKGDSVIDIGGNDGTLLKYVNPKKTRIGVDPSQFNMVGLDLWIHDYWENVVIPRKVDTITAIACLYDLPNPNKFMKKVKEYLNPNGIFIAQLMTLEPMIENNDVGNICHEHIEYYSYKSLVTLYEQNGLEIYKVEKNKMNGGSYRIFARHYQKGSIKYKEKQYGVKELKNFFKRIEENRIKLLEFTLPKAANIIGYGASTKAATICQYYGVKPKYIVDINPNKIGKYTIYGSRIINRIPSDTDVLWVFPYGFIDYFKKKEKNYKGKWITTIPKFKIWD